MGLYIVTGKVEVTMEYPYFTLTVRPDHKYVSGVKSELIQVYDPSELVTVLDFDAVDIVAESEEDAIEQVKKELEDLDTWEGAVQDEDGTFMFDYKDTKKVRIIDITAELSEI